MNDEWVFRGSCELSACVDTFRTEGRWVYACGRKERGGGDGKEGGVVCFPICRDCAFGVGEEERHISRHGL